MYASELRGAITSRWAERNIRRTLRGLHGTPMPHADSLSELETLMYGYVGELARRNVSRRASMLRSALLFAPVWAAAFTAMGTLMSGAVTGTVVGASTGAFLAGGLLTMVWLEGTAREALEEWVIATSDPHGKVPALEMLEAFGGVEALPLVMLDDAKTNRYKAGSIDSALVWWWSQLEADQRTVILSQGRTTSVTIGEVLEAFDRCRS